MSIESGEVHDWPPVTSAHASRGQPDATPSLMARPVASIRSARDPLKQLQGVVAFSDPLRFQPTHSDSLHSSSFTRRATRAVVGADSETADGVYLKRPAPGPAPCRRANPGLHLATLQASGRVALAPRRCAVTRASVVRESISPLR